MAAALLIKQDTLSDNSKSTLSTTKTILETVARWSEEKWQTELKKYCDDISLMWPKHRLAWLSAVHDLLEGSQLPVKTTLAESRSLPSMAAQHKFVPEQKTLAIINEFAGLLCDWQLQIKSCQKRNQLSIKEISSLAYAYWKSGDWPKAFELLERQMLLNPDDHINYSFYRYLIQLANTQAFSYFSENDIAPKLSLEPLSNHHLDEFFWQYWDPDIAELCCLPHFYDRQHWYDWMAQQQSLNDQVNYAIRHADLGFVGVVSLVIHQHVGFFYFWIGRDFQGVGLGTNAVSLLLKLGQEFFAMKSCYAKVFEHNIASQRAMFKLGFKRLSVNAAPPCQNEYLYYLGEEKSDKKQCMELQQLFENMCSETQVDIPLAWRLLNVNENLDNQLDTI